MPRSAHRSALDHAWTAFADPRQVRSVDEVSANVSTNRVYRLHLDDGSSVIAKVSSYGSFYLFLEDHERLNRCASLLHGTRFDGMLAEVWQRDGQLFTWSDRERWAVFYDDVPRRRSLPRVLDQAQVTNLGREMASFHRACAEIAVQIPPSSKTIKIDAIRLLDALEADDAEEHFGLAAEHIDLLVRHTYRFLDRLHLEGYDEWQRIPVLIDWNLGNFSVEFAADGSFRLFSRWDYDWFRIEPRPLDFYFLSRVSSRTGDRTQFTYGPHTLVEPTFLAFLRAYQAVFPLRREEIEFLPEVYRFFILNYVVRDGARFFRPDLCAQFRNDAVTRFLPALERLDVSPLREL